MKNNILIFEIKKIFKESAHIGHKSLNNSKSWHPLITNYLLGIRNNISIIDINQTSQYLLNAFYIITLIIRKKGCLLIVNTNPEFFNIFKNITYISNYKKKDKINDYSSLKMGKSIGFSRKGQETCKVIKKKLFQGSLVNKVDLDLQSINRVDQLASSKPLISYYNNKWIGGTLTNWKQISKSALIFAKFSQRFDHFLIKNNIYFPQYKKMKKRFHGLVIKKDHKVMLSFQKTPDLILIVNPNENKNVIHEANCLHIPIIAFTDSNTDLSGISYPIPVNSNSIHFIYLFLNWIFKIIKK